MSAPDLEQDSLPTGWLRATLEALAQSRDAITDGPFGSNLKSAHYVASGVRVIRLGNVGTGEFKHDDVSFVSATHAASLTRHVVDKGDLIIAALADPVGRCCEVPASILPAIVKADCVRFRPSPHVLARFIMHWMNSPVGSKNAERHSHGVGRLRINMQEMRALDVPLAPLPEQRRIVAAIETQFTRLDDAVATLKVVQAKLKRARASVLQAAVEGRLVPTEAALAKAEGRSYEPASALLERILVERRARWPKGKKYQPPIEPKTEDLPALPEGWTWATLDQASFLVRNGYSKKPAEHGLTRILRISAVRPNSVDTSDCRWLPESLDAFADATAWPGDLLFTRYNGTRALVGVCGMLRSHEPIVHPDKLIRVATLPGVVVPNYVEKAANVGVSRAFIEDRIRTTAGQAGVSGADIKQLPFPLPPLAEQQRIVAEVERRLSVLDSLEHSVEQSLARCTRLRQSILKRAFEGRLVPQDPNDEPAHVLLERIRAERAAHEART